MLLGGKNAIVYGGGGSIGGAVARAFAAEGARVHLAGRTTAPLERVADDVRAAGGLVETTVLDALDGEAVDAHAQRVVDGFGSLDISFNAITHGDVQGTPMIEMDLADYERPIVTATRTFFLTSRAAGRHMTAQGSGVILVFGGDGPPMRDVYLGGLQPAFQVMESMRRQLSAELGRRGVRVVTLQTAGIYETVPADVDLGDIVDRARDETMLGRNATLADVAHAAVFAVSDWAASLTATKINISCGTMVD